MTRPLVSRNLDPKQSYLSVTARSGRKVRLPVRSVKILDQLGLLHKLAQPGYDIHTNSDYVRITLFILSHHQFTLRELVEWTTTTFKELKPSSVRASARTVLQNLCSQGYLVRSTSVDFGNSFNFVI